IGELSKAPAKSRGFCFADSRLGPHVRCRHLNPHRAVRHGTLRHEGLNKLAARPRGNASDD
ncbi:MAG TPA: hypothetical protein VF467_18150, partial [Afipia sp.]